MANYSAGSLEFNIISTADSASMNLQTVVTKLQNMSVALSSVITGFGQLKSVVKGVTTEDLKWITSLSTRLGNLSKKDLVTTAANFIQLTNSISPFIDKVRSAETSLVALAKVMASMGNTNKIANAMNLSAQKSTIKSSSFMQGGLGKMLNFGWAIGKIYFLVNYTKRLAQAVAGVVQKGIDYTEVLNMWQVSMRNNIDLADEFISKMTKAYGISETNLMKYQATFKNMLSALGSVSEEMSYGLSESLTQMAIDYSSLFNVTMETSMTTFRAMLAGQVRPIRSISGYDVTENTIFQLYQDIGGTKTMRQLSQIEKRLLRIYATYRQMGATGAVGDMAKTIEQAANQLRIMSELGTELATWVGIIAKGFLESSGALVSINAGLIVAKNIVQAMATYLGYETPDFLTNLLTTTEDANEEVDKLQGKLLSFDKFESLNVSANAEGGNIDEQILKIIAQYQSVLEGTSYKAQALSESWMATLGFEYDAVTGLWEYKDGMGSIVDMIKQAGEGLLGWGTLFYAIKHPISALFVALGYMYFISEDIRTSVNSIFDTLGKWHIGQKILDDLGLVLSALTSIIDIVAKVLDWTINLIFGGAKIGDGNTTAGEKIMGDLVSALTIGALVGIKTGSAVAFTLTAGLILLLNSYNVDYADDSNIIYNKVISGIGAGLVGGVIGFKIGGIFGVGGVGLVVGVGLALVIQNLINISKSQSTEDFYAALIASLILCLGGAAMGWYFATAGGVIAGPMGAVIGFAVGAALSLIITSIDWSTILDPLGIQQDLNDQLKRLGVQSIANLVTNPTTYPNQTSSYTGTVKKPKAAAYASGGFVEDGIFTMNKGELAGDFFDGTPVVANNNQIIQGIRAGVYEGVAQAMKSSGTGGDVYLDGTKVGRVIESKVHSEGVRVGHFASQGV